MPDPDHTITHRVRFETRCIAPMRTPKFAYVASVLTHSSIQYTALVPVRDDEADEAAIVDVVSYWPDATIHAIEVGANGFKAQDLSLTQSVFGTVHSTPRDRPPRVVTWWFSLFGYVPTKIRDGRSTFIPGTGIRTEGNHNQPSV